jgi:hypothetical protein
VLGEGVVGDAEHAADALGRGLRVHRRIEVEHDAPGELLHAHRREIGERAEQALLEAPEEERAIASLEADLVVVDHHHARPRRLRHHSASVARGCLGRRR